VTSLLPFYSRFTVGELFLLLCTTAFCTGFPVHNEALSAPRSIPVSLLAESSILLLSRFTVGQVFKEAHIQGVAS